MDMDPDTFRRLEESLAFMRVLGDTQGRNAVSHREIQKAISYVRKEGYVCDEDMPQMARRTGLVDPLGALYAAAGYGLLFHLSDGETDYFEFPVRDYITR